MPSSVSINPTDVFSSFSNFSSLYRLSTVEEMKKLGLYINDLSNFDGTSEMIVTEMQHLSVLQAAIDKQHAWTSKLKETKRDLNKWRAKSKGLLYSMLPRHVAKKIESGVKPNTICDVNIEVFYFFYELNHFLPHPDIQPSDNYVYKYNGFR
jgi:hypothetical protein